LNNYSNVQSNIQILQGSWAVRRCGEFYSFLCGSSLKVTVKLIKSFHICQSSHKNKSGTFLWTTVCCIWSSSQEKAMFSWLIITVWNSSCIYLLVTHNQPFRSINSRTYEKIDREFVTSAFKFVEVNELWDFFNELKFCSCTALQ